jgi:hydroxyquinol 1,2-dioxygenase
MRDFNEHNATEAVLARLESCADPRLREVMICVIRHLHAVAREIEPTPDEC